MIINGDAKSNLQVSINVMEAARIAGYTHVSFAVQQGREVTLARAAAGGRDWTPPLPSPSATGTG